MNASQDALIKMAVELKSRSTAQVVGETASYSFVVFLQLVGNFLTLLMFCLNRRLRTVCNLFVASLAVTDFGLAVMSAIPLGATVLATSEWPFSDATCQYQGVIAITMAVGSTQTLGWMAVNRYFRIVKSAKYLRYFTMKSSILIVFISWILAFFAPLSYIFAGNKFVFHPAKFFCYLHVDSGPFTAFIVTVYIGLPSAVIAFCYFRVFQSVRRHAMLQNATENQRIMMKEIKITKTLFAIVVFYMLCWTPVLLIDLIDTFRGTWSFSRPAYVSYSFLATISSAINPIIYGIMNKTFRNEYRRMLACGLKESVVAPFSAVQRPRTRQTLEKSAAMLVLDVNADTDEM